MKIIGGKPSKRPVKPKIRCVASALAACAAVSFFTAGAARNFDSFRDTAAIAAAGFVFPEGLLPAAPAADPAPDPAESPSGDLRTILRPGTVSGPLLRIRDAERVPAVLSAAAERRGSFGPVLTGAIVRTGGTVLSGR